MTSTLTASQRYLDSFPGSVEEFAIEGLDVLDVPLHRAVLPPGTQHPGGSGLGYGATREEARTGALGEMAEMALSLRAHRGVEREQGSHAELREYLTVVAALEFDAVATPFELVPGVTTDHVVHLVRRLLSGPPDAAPVALEEL